MLINNNPFSLVKGLFAYRAYYYYREYIKSNFNKYWVKGLTNFKPEIKRIGNNIILFIAVIGADFNKLKAYIIVIVKLAGELNTVLIML